MAIKYTTPEVAKNTTSRDIEALAAQVGNNTWAYELPVLSNATLMF